MNERKDDIIVGLLVVIIILQIYGLFFGNNSTSMSGEANWQNYGAQEVPTLSAEEQPSMDDVKETLGDSVKKIDANDDPQSGANIPSAPKSSQIDGVDGASDNASTGK